MIIRTVTETNFRDAFYATERGDNFSGAGLRALYNYFENECEDIIQLNVFSICCDYSELPLDDIIATYRLVDIADYTANNDDVAEIDYDAYYEAALVALDDNTTIISDTANADGDTLIVFAEF